MTRNHLNNVRNWGSRKHTQDRLFAVCLLSLSFCLACPHPVPPGTPLLLQGPTPAQSPQLLLAVLPTASRGSGSLPGFSPPLEHLSHCVRETGSPKCIRPLCCYNLWFTHLLDILPKILDPQNLKISLNPTGLPVKKGVIPVCIGRSFRSWASRLALA